MVLWRSLGHQCACQFRTGCASFRHVPCSAYEVIGDDLAHNRVLLVVGVGADEPAHPASCGKELTCVGGEQ